jgi:hypothetical protein
MKKLSFLFVVFALVSFMAVSSCKSAAPEVAEEAATEEVVEEVVETEVADSVVVEEVAE